MSIIKIFYSVWPKSWSKSAFRRVVIVMSHIESVILFSRNVRSIVFTFLSNILLLFDKIQIISYEIPVRILGDTILKLVYQAHSLYFCYFYVAVFAGINLKNSSKFHFPFTILVDNTSTIFWTLKSLQVLNHLWQAFKRGNHSCIHYFYICLTSSWVQLLRLWRF